MSSDSARIIEFLMSIGLEIRLAPIAAETFLPGIAIEGGAMVVDEAKLLYPGDLLHEAGHLALMAPEARRLAEGSVGDDGGMEMGAIAWSYAAAVHLGIALDVLFHPAGYKGASKGLIGNYTSGGDMGVPILDWLGLSHTAKHARQLGVTPFPAMIRWLREADSVQ